MNIEDPFIYGMVGGLIGAWISNIMKLIKMTRRVERLEAILDVASKRIDFLEKRP